MEGMNKGALASAHEHFCFIWLLAKQGKLGNLDSASRALGRMMLEHPQYQHLWETPYSFTGVDLKTVGEREGISPYLHLAIQATVFEEIESGEPPETAKAYEALLRAGVTMHEARHTLGRVLAEIVWMTSHGDARMPLARGDLYLRRLEFVAKHPLKALNGQIQQLRQASLVTGNQHSQRAERRAGKRDKAR